MQVTNPLLSHVKEMINRLVGKSSSSRGRREELIIILDPTGKKRLRNDALAEIADFSISPNVPLQYPLCFMGSAVMNSFYFTVNSILTAIKILHRILIPFL